MECLFVLNLRAEGISFAKNIHREHFLRLDFASTGFVRRPVGGPWLQQYANLPSSQSGRSGSLSHIRKPVIGSNSSKVGGKKRCKTGGKVMSKSSKKAVFGFRWGDDIVVTWFPNGSGNNVRSWSVPWRLSGASSPVGWVKERTVLGAADIDAMMR